MDTSKFEKWLDDALKKHTILTGTVCTILENLLRSNNVDYLAVTGRTKTRQSALEKISRKGYKDPARQITDLSGIRVIVYFESDVLKTSAIIKEAFNVDNDNSLNQSDLLSTDQTGYRSVHFVCDLGDNRCSLPEFKGLGNLKFEFQVRTILQHAWAELAHDRNYKFSGKLPKEIERKLYLYAGMLEIADKGFDEISAEIDNYAEGIKTKTEKGELDTEINSITLREFTEQWGRDNNIELEFFGDLDELVDELSQFGITTLSELNAIIPKGYAEISKKEYREKTERTIYGTIRDWMLIHDWRKFVNEVKFNWGMENYKIFDKIFPRHELLSFKKAFPLDENEYEFDFDEDFVDQ